MLYASYKNHIIYCSAYAAIYLFFVDAAIKAAAVGNESARMCIVYALSSLIFAWALYSEVVYMRLRAKLPPGDSGWPLLGHFPGMVLGGLDFSIRMAKQYGSLYTMNFIGKPCVVFVNDEDVVWIQAQERKGNVVSFTAPHLTQLLGKESMLFAQGAHSRRLRRMIEPAFSQKSIVDYVQIMDSTVQSDLRKMALTDDFCSLEVISLMTLRIFFKCAIGGNIDEGLLRQLNSLFSDWAQGFLTLFPIALPGTTLDKAFRARKTLNEVVATIIANFKRENPIASNAATTTVLGRLCYGKDDNGQSLTDSQLVSNVMILVFAGYDTTKGSVGSSFYCLTQNPKIMNLLVKEVSSFSDPLDFDELKDAPLINAFLSEMWRVVPPVACHVTQVVKDLEYKGYHIPKGVTAAFSMNTQNYFDEDKFPKPSEFRLERWIADKNHPMYDAHFYTGARLRTFSEGGSHMCVGYHFAKLQARIVLTRVLQRYSLEIRNLKMTSFPVNFIDCEYKLSEKK